MKGKTLTGLVLVVEIASIAILHAVKINHSEKTAKEFNRTQPAAEATDSRAKPVITLAVLK